MLNILGHQLQPHMILPVFHKIILSEQWCFWHWELTKKENMSISQLSRDAVLKQTFWPAMFKLPNIYCFKKAKNSQYSACLQWFCWHARAKHLFLGKKKTTNNPGLFPDAIKVRESDNSGYFIIVPSNFSISLHSYFYSAGLL